MLMRLASLRTYDAQLADSLSVIIARPGSGFCVVPEEAAADRRCFRTAPEYGYSGADHRSAVPSVFR